MEQNLCHALINKHKLSLVAKRPNNSSLITQYLIAVQYGLKLRDKSTLEGLKMVLSGELRGAQSHEPVSSGFVEGKFEGHLWVLKVLICG